MSISPSNTFHIVMLKLPVPGSIAPSCELGAHKYSWFMKFLTDECRKEPTLTFFYKAFTNLFIRGPL